MCGWIPGAHFWQLVFLNLFTRKFLIKIFSILFLIFKNRIEWKRKGDIRGTGDQRGLYKYIPFDNRLFDSCYCRDCAQSIIACVASVDSRCGLELAF